MKNNRLSWDEYFMAMAHLVATRSTCLRRQVGAVIIKDKQICATGYNGAPRGWQHCAETGCLREKLGVPSGERHEICRAVHAEQNAIAQAARHGISINGAALYCTLAPCMTCLKLMENAGIVEVIFTGEYPNFLWDESLIEIRRFEQ